MNNLRPFDTGKTMRTDAYENPAQALQTAYQAFNNADPRGEAGVVTAVKASYTTVLAGANNDLVFTAVIPGTQGNNITVTYVDPGGVTATLGVVVAGSAITVNLGRAASAINTTATALKAAVDAAPAAAALVTVANSGADDGTGLVTAMSVQSLAGGVSGKVGSGQYTGRHTVAEGPIGHRVPGEYVTQTGQVASDDKKHISDANKDRYPKL